MHVLSTYVNDTIIGSVQIFFQVFIFFVFEQGLKFICSVEGVTKAVPQRRPFEVWYGASLGESKTLKM
jgi:hypothetical protein